MTHPASGRHLINDVTPSAGDAAEGALVVPGGSSDRPGREPHLQGPHHVQGALRHQTEGALPCAGYVTCRQVESLDHGVRRGSSVFYMSGVYDLFTVNNR